ncbi:hypothetical protein GCM10017786_50830 [Amycolatopsis deserti]|uniref:Uncharacterized protein n=1 Tax=Amycolatopsis deserti TaxID=185696 RepID=A0ABQ3JE86_9PSEU|nr:hypothetical protein [Amycolatopsis deserti]GHF10984.1 hypothetical protein GCM10017786_50830 [Amycolatopsis deserti]
MTRPTTAGNILVRVLLGIAGAFAVTLVSWLVASSASADEAPDPLSPLLGLVGETTEPVHEVVRQVTEVVVPPLRTDRIVASLTGTAPVFAEPVRHRATGTTRASAPKPPAVPDRRATAVAPRPPEPQPVPAKVTSPAPRKAALVSLPERVPDPVPAEPASDKPKPDEPRPDAPEPAAPVPPEHGVCVAPGHATDTAAACPARPAPPPIPFAVVAESRSVVAGFFRAERAQVSPD